MKTESPVPPAAPARASWEERWRELISGQTRGPGAMAARAGLRGLASLYGGGIGAYRAAYDLGLIRTVPAECRVISVGNLTVGGTGKSTTVRWLATWLRDRGVPVAVLSYGYGSAPLPSPCGAPASGGPIGGRHEEEVTVVSDGCQVLVPESASGDEPRMLAEALPGVPVLTGKRRQFSAAEAVRRFGARVCVLDDAFQYWRLVKDLDIVLIDALCPFGGEHLLPRGLLREAPRQLRRAHAVIITNGQRILETERAALRQRLRCLNPGALLAEARHSARALRPLREPSAVGCRLSAATDRPLPETYSRQPTADSHLRGRRVLALSSLGNPAGFEQMLIDLGAEVVPARYPDHHHYRPEELQDEEERARAMDCAMIVTTEKDAVKIDPCWVSAVPFWVLPVELEFDAGRDELEELLEALVR